MEKRKGDIGYLGFEYLMLPVISIKRPFGFVRDRQDGMNVKTALNQHVRSPSPLCHGFRSREAGSMHVDFQDRGFVAFVDPGITSHYEFEIQSDSGI